MDGVYDYEDGISAVDSRLVRVGQTAAHVVIERGRAAVIDVPTGHCVPRVLEALASKGIGPEQVDYVILTHVHLDHAGGAGRLMAMCPNARLTVHPRGARHMIDPSRLMAATVDIYGAEAAERMYGQVVPVPSERVVETPEGATVSLAGREFAFFETPGHARHHVVIRDGRTGHLFVGDTFGLSYREADRGARQFSFPTTSPSQFDPPALHDSIARVVGLAPEALYVTHFGRLSDIPRLAADLHRLIDAHVGLAHRCRDTGAERHARLVAGVRDLLVAEARCQNWALSGGKLVDVFALDIELNAQGLEVWLDSAG